MRIQKPLLLLLICLQADLFAENAPRPNVLLIAIDDLNDWVSCLGGHPDSKTPNIDRLAVRGVLFTNAHCQAPICNPSRTSFMLGMRPSTTGIYVNRPWFRQTPANRKQVTLTQHFRAQGYKTYTTGKIYHGSRFDPPSFEVEGPRPGQTNRLDKHLRPDMPSKSRLWDMGPQEYEDEKFNDFICASWAIEQLKLEQEKPLFVTVGFVRPHVPLYAPKRLFDSHPAESIDLPPVKNDDRDDLPESALKLTDNPTPPSHSWFVDNDSWRPAVQAYIAAVRFVDEQIGRLLDALDTSGHKDNTIIILLSDHGFHLGEKQRWAKQSLWERSTRVPFIVSVPGGLKGSKCSKPVELLSIYPTLIELCDIEKRSDLEGVSITQLLKSPDSDWQHPAITTYRQNNHAIRSEHYRYIRYSDGAEELYDHRKDPNEWNNLAANPESAEVKKKHARWLPKVNVPEAKGTQRPRKKLNPRS